MCIVSWTKLYLQRIFTSHTGGRSRLYTVIGTFEHKLHWSTVRFQIDRWIYGGVWYDGLDSEDDNGSTHLRCRLVDWSMYTAAIFYCQLTHQRCAEFFDMPGRDGIIITLFIRTGERVWKISDGAASSKVENSGKMQMIQQLKQISGWRRRWVRLTTE